MESNQVRPTPPSKIAPDTRGQAQEEARRCVHCGFCHSACPTYQLLGDELDSPRGRIVLMKAILNEGVAPTSKSVRHIDRCLSCLSCTSSCPSGVNYRRLIDETREVIEQTYRRPRSEQLFRAMIAKILPFRRRFAFFATLARLASPFAFLVAWHERAYTLLKLAGPRRRSERLGAPETIAKPLRRVALFDGCVQPVLEPAINASAARLFARIGIACQRIEGEGCCGALVHHMGRGKEAKAFAAANVRAFAKALDDGCDAIIITATGCGSTIMDYAALLGGAPEAKVWNAIRERVHNLSSFLLGLELPEQPANGFRLAYHSPCSEQHGLKIKTQAQTLLCRVGFEVVEPKDSHLCCGGAGIYNVMQPDLSKALLARKVENLEALEPQAIASSNLGCLSQLGRADTVPRFHFVEFLDWALNGEPPAPGLAFKPPAKEKAATLIA